MSKPNFPPTKSSTHEENNSESNIRGKLRATKGALRVVESLRGGNPERMIEQAIISGIKMASDKAVFLDSLANPLKIASELKRLGIGVLGWLPETLMSTLDQKYSNWTKAQVSEALDYFNKTGTIKTSIPQLVREKIYAIRVVATSDSAQAEWHIFEKVGGAFNDRVAKFGVVEPLTAAECARTIAVIENIRPDRYENEVKIYIAAACHYSGLYTVAPIKWLSFVENYLQQMNYEATSEHQDQSTKNKIQEKFNQMKANKEKLVEVPDDLISVQALKLLSIDEYAEEVTRV